MEIVPKYSISTVLIIMTIYFVFSYQTGRTPLHKAVDSNNVKIFRLLIQSGAKSNVPNKVMVCFILQTTNVYDN